MIRSQRGLELDSRDCYDRRDLIGLKTLFPRWLTDDEDLDEEEIFAYYWAHAVITCIDWEDGFFYLASLVPENEPISWSFALHISYKRPQLKVLEFLLPLSDFELNRRQWCDIRLYAAYKRDIELLGFSMHVLGNSILNKQDHQLLICVIQDYEASLKDIQMLKWMYNHRFKLYWKREPYIVTNWLTDPRFGVVRWWWVCRFVHPDSPWRRSKQMIKRARCFNRTLMLWSKYNNLPLDVENIVLEYAGIRY
jgi:hypothetical protein